MEQLLVAWLRQNQNPKIVRQAKVLPLRRDMETLLTFVRDYKVNWLIAYSYTGMGDSLPKFFNLFALDDLLALPAKTRISFEKFADALIEKTGLTWSAPERSIATTALRGSIARMVIHILADFGVMESEYRKEPLGKGTVSRLVAFKITPLGKSLIEAVAINTRANTII
jgi:hypothetical protein